VLVNLWCSGEGRVGGTKRSHLGRRPSCCGRYGVIASSLEAIVVDYGTMKCQLIAQTMKSLIEPVWLPIDVL